MSVREAAPAFAAGIPEDVTRAVTANAALAPRKSDGTQRIADGFVDAVDLVATAAAGRGRTTATGDEGRPGLSEGCR